MPASVFLTCTVDQRRYAIAAADVVEVVRAVAVDVLPGAPPVVTGVIDYRGSLLPVFDVARRFQHTVRPVRAAHRLIIARAGKRTVALHVDDVDNLVEIAEDRMDRAPTPIAPDVPIAGLARTSDGVLVIQDLERFLSDGESQQLDSAFAAR